MADTFFVGMRGTDDFVTNELPQNWRQGILRVFPNGMVSLTALTALMKSEKLVGGPVFNWWTKTFNARSAAVTGKYTDSLLSSSYGGSGDAGDILYIKMTEANSKMFRAGHQVLLRDASDLTVDVNSKVVAVTQNGASSCITVKLLEDDDNGSTNAGSHDLQDCDTAKVIGDINPQGGTRPEATVHTPSHFYNHCQIMREALDLARTAEQTTNLRTANPYQEAKLDCLEQFSGQMENNFWWSTRTSNTGSNGKPEYTGYGVIPFLKANYSTNVVDFEYDSGAAFAGKTWLQAGEEWFDTQLELYFRWATEGKILAFCGSGALLGLQKLVKDVGMFTFKPATLAYGIKVLEWITPFGSMYLKTHPLFSQSAADRNSIVMLTPSNLRYKYVQDIKYEPDLLFGKGGGTGKDGRDEGYLVECGIEMHHPETFMYLTGVGKDNLYT